MNGRECLRGGAGARGSTGTAVNSVLDPEMWVLNQADHVAKGVSDCRHLDVTADRLHGVARLGAAVNQTPVGAVDIRNAPVRNGVVPDLLHRWHQDRVRARIPRRRTRRRTVHLNRGSRRRRRRTTPSPQRDPGRIDTVRHPQKHGGSKRRLGHSELPFALQNRHGACPPDADADLSKLRQGTGRPRIVCEFCGHRADAAGSVPAPSGTVVDKPSAELRVNPRVEAAKPTNAIRNAILVSAAIGAIAAVMFIVRSPGSNVQTNTPVTMTAPVQAHHSMPSRCRRCASRDRVPRLRRSRAQRIQSPWATHGSRTIGFEVEAERDVTVYMDRARPVLAVRCISRQTEVFVVLGSAPSIENGDNTHTVRIGLDDWPRCGAAVARSSNLQALFAPDDPAFAAGMASAQRSALRVQAVQCAVCPGRIRRARIRGAARSNVEDLCSLGEARTISRVTLVADHVCTDFSFSLQMNSMRSLSRMRRWFTRTLKGAVYALGLSIVTSIRSVP